MSDTQPSEPVSAQPVEPAPGGTNAARPLLYGCLSLLLAVPFAILYIMFFLGFGPIGGVLCAAVVVGGLFFIRRENKKPIIGALAVGAAIAFAVQGTCLLIMTKSA